MLRRPGRVLPNRGCYVVYCSLSRSAGMHCGAGSRCRWAARTVTHSRFLGRVFTRVQLEIALLADESVLARVGDGTGAIAAAGFREDAVDVGLDRGFADKQLRRDFGVG